MCPNNSRWSTFRFCMALNMVSSLKRLCDYKRWSKRLRDFCPIFANDIWFWWEVPWLFVHLTLSLWNRGVLIDSRKMQPYLHWNNTTIKSTLAWSETLVSSKSAALSIHWILSKGVVKGPIASMTFRCASISRIHIVTDWLTE